MSYSQSLALRGLEPNEEEAVVEYLKHVAPNHHLYASQFAVNAKISTGKANSILYHLVQEKMATANFAVRCPECGLMFKRVESPADIESSMICNGCDEEVEITAEDVDVFYTLHSNPFVTGQRNDIAPASSAVPSADTLAQLIINGTIDINREFYAPTEDQYQELVAMYQAIFDSRGKPMQKGDSLNFLAERLFNLCKHFRITIKALTNTNQLDGLVRNTLFMPGVAPIGNVSTFVIECKNEIKKPKGEYMSKMADILNRTDQSFGIIISKHSPPKTFRQIAYANCLKFGNIIISMDQSDLHDIIIERKNLLECMERKIVEVKMNVKSDLCALGVYE